MIGRGRAYTPSTHMHGLFALDLHVSHTCDLNQLFQCLGGLRAGSDYGRGGGGEGLGAGVVVRGGGGGKGRGGVRGRGGGKGAGGVRGRGWWLEAGVVVRGRDGG